MTTSGTLLARTTQYPPVDNPEPLRVRAANRVALAGHRALFRFGRAVNALSECGARFVAEFEGVRLHPYNDPVQICTIGIGHVEHFSPCDGTEASLPNEQAAWDLLRADMAASYMPTLDGVVVSLTQQQRDALGSFIYNIGSNGFRSSTLLRVLNQGRGDLVPSELMKWNKANNQPLPGLTRRRQREGTLFSTGWYGFPCEPVVTSRRHREDADD